MRNPDSKLPSKQARYRRGNNGESGGDNEPISADFYRRTACYSPSRAVHVDGACRGGGKGEKGGCWQYGLLPGRVPRSTCRENFVKFLFFFSLPPSLPLSPSLFLSLAGNFATRFCPRFCPRIQFYGRRSCLPCSPVPRWTSASPRVPPSHLLSCRRHSRRNFCSIPVFFLLGRFTRRQFYINRAYDTAKRKEGKRKEKKKRKRGNPTRNNSPNIPETYHRARLLASRLEACYNIPD